MANFPSSVPKDRFSKSDKLADRVATMRSKELVDASLPQIAHRERLTVV